MKFDVPAELYGNLELVRELNKQLLTREQYNQIFKSVITIKFQENELLPLSDWLKQDYPDLPMIDIKKYVSIIFTQLEKECIITEATKNCRRSFVDDRYGRKSGKSLHFYRAGYTMIKKELDLNKIITFHGEYDNATNVCKKHGIPFVKVRKLYGLLETYGFIQRQKNGGRRPTDMGKAYMKTYKNSKGVTSCLFNVNKFKELLNEIHWYTGSDSSDEMQGYSISEIAAICGYKVDMKKAHCDSIIKEINKDLKLSCIIEKPDNKRWRFTNDGIEDNWGYNEVKGKTVQAKFYANKKVKSYVSKMVKELKEEK